MRKEINVAFSLSHSPSYLLRRRKSNKNPDQNRPFYPLKPAPLAPIPVRIRQTSGYSGNFQLGRAAGIDALTDDPWSTSRPAASSECSSGRPAGLQRERHHRDPCEKNVARTGIRHQVVHAYHGGC